MHFYKMHKKHREDFTVARDDFRNNPLEYLPEWCYHQNGWGYEQISSTHSILNNLGTIFEEATIMNAYLASVLENVRTKHGNEPEFVQTVEEVLSSLEPVIEKHPEY